MVKVRPEGVLAIYGYVISSNFTCHIGIAKKMDDVPVISFAVDVDASEEFMEDNS